MDQLVKKESEVREERSKSCQSRFRMILYYHVILELCIAIILTIFCMLSVVVVFRGTGNGTKGERGPKGEKGEKGEGPFVPPGPQGIN